MVDADHRRARAGRRDDHVVAGERVDEPFDERNARLLVAGVEVHLAAARLFRRELDVMTEAAHQPHDRLADLWEQEVDRKSTRLNSSHTVISYAVFCLK